ncbi:MAG: NifB/NifX family molybdenum-iron cluster-binding protein [Candidatus Altiarchaeota archaeon]
MNIAVATTKGGLDDSVSPIFGRCIKITLVECEGGEISNVVITDNPGFMEAGGAGIKAAQYVSGLNAEAVIAGNFGPNASTVLSQSGVNMLLSQGTVKDSVEKYINGELTNVSGPTVESHHGMGARGFGGHGRRHGNTNIRGD